jgi:hypothetical protein
MNFKARNCLTYALSKWLNDGGYIMVRKSMIAELHGVGKYHVLNLVPHFLHKSRNGVITQLVRTPEENERAKSKGPWFDWLWLWHFDGMILEGDHKFMGVIDDKT